ncbi:Gfo/Idh/MocA family protein, partial [Halorubrum lacusprofundi]|uniref:Gfo/Idh/MocA family protein n=1 Tax=Halorubrum lacusprofundi TaxID=2247 RepID=UPI0037441F4C
RLSVAGALDVLWEKPLAHTVESAERIAEAARDAEGFCMIGFNNRFAEPVQVLKGYQEEGRFGETTHVEANYVRRRGVPGRGSWFTSEAVAGGGAPIVSVVPPVDLALDFLDHPHVLAVSGETRPPLGDPHHHTFYHLWCGAAGHGAYVRRA